MSRLIYTVIVLFILVSSYGQSKQDYMWVFGQEFNSSGGVYGTELNFNTPTTEVKDRYLEYGLGSANASICDKEGNFLFYTNGCAVVNQDFEMMTNGDSLGYDIWWDVLNQRCELGIGSFQDHMILPDPANEDQYYILHKPRLFNGFQAVFDSIPIWYSKVDMSLEDGKGEVIVKNEVLDKSRIFLTSYLTAINHTNGEDWWVIQAPSRDSILHTYKIDDEGIRLELIQESHHYFTSGRSSASGTAKFSPDGKKYAFYNYYDQLHIYDFDRNTGVLSSHKQIFAMPDPINSDIVFSSLEWSSNSRFIYAASGEWLYQLDLWEDDIQEDGIRLIDTYNGTLDPFTTSFFLMAQAPDCKIYMSPTNGSYSFHVINKPNELGTACNFVQNGLKLNYPSNGGGLPNFPRFRVDEEDKCDPTLTSVFGDAVYYRRDLTVYPSPSDGRYTVEMPDDFRSGTLSIINLDGQIVESKLVSVGTLSVAIDITRYPSGYYHVELYPDENVDRLFWSRQVVKE